MKRSLALASVALAVTAAPVAAEGASPNPLTVDGGLALWTLFVFGLLLYVLKKSAWPTLLGAVRDREQRLEQQIAEAERNRAEAQRLLEEHKRLLAQAQGEAQDILNQAKTAGEKEREALLAKARAEYDDLLARARKEIAAEQEMALIALRREAVDLTIAAASKLIEAKLDTETNRRLVTEYLASVEHRS
jgi:F-type H+-transporting ATPase subunit b